MPAMWGALAVQTAVPIILPGHGDSKAGSKLMLGPCCSVDLPLVTWGAGKGRNCC